MIRIPRRLVALPLLLVFSLSAEVRTLTILHLNDIHAHLTPDSNHRGGFAYLATVIRRGREHCADCILLNAGDLVQGSPVSTMFRGLPIFEIANLFGFDAAVLGNHEFDYGWMQTRKFLATANYPIVTANLVDPSGRLMTPRPYVILTVNHLRVAVIGALTADLPTLVTPKMLGDWRTLPVVATARKYAAELRNQADLIVLLGHIGPQEEQALLNDAPEIGVTVSGHLHDGLTQELSRDKHVLVRVKSFGEELGRLQLQVDTETKLPTSWTWKRIQVDSAAVPAAPDVSALVTHWEAEVSEHVDKPLAMSLRKFTQSEVRDLIELAMRDETGADFAFLNLDSVRATLPEGQLLERHIWNVMPFDNEVVIGTFKGRDIPLVARNGRQVDPDRDYTLAVSDFTAGNQSARGSLGTSGLQFPKQAGTMRDLIMDWVRKKRVIPPQN